MLEFRWNGWNRDHIARHGIAQQEAENIVRAARRPFPQRLGGGKLIVIGRLFDGTYVQVIYVLDVDRTVFVIHARPLNEAEKRRFRRRTR